MIRSFKNALTEALYNNVVLEGFPADLAKVARRKLEALNAAKTLGDLRSPPGNRPHPLDGDRSGPHAIRINDQFRICFVRKDDGPREVEIVDYH